MAVEIKAVGPQGKKEYRVKISAELHQQLQEAEEALRQHGWKANINDEVVKTLERALVDINRHLEKAAPVGNAGIAAANSPQIAASPNSTTPAVE